MLGLTSLPARAARRIGKCGLSAGLTAPFINQVPALLLQCPWLIANVQALINTAINAPTAANIDEDWRLA